MHSGYLPSRRFQLWRALQGERREGILNDIIFPVRGEKRGSIVYRSRSGIVLKQYEKRQTVALLDKKVGRVDAIAYRSLCVGSLLHYSIEKELFGTFYISDVTITDLPFDLGRSDIFFWHHVLELCYYFVPIGVHTSQLFELLAFLYTVDTGICWKRETKKIFLFKLLSTIGLYTDLPAFAPVRVHQLLAVPLHIIEQEQLDEEQEKILDQWLRVCIADHPAIKYFKTIQFLSDRHV